MTNRKIFLLTLSVLCQSCVENVAFDRAGDEIGPITINAFKTRNALGAGMASLKAGFLLDGTSDSLLLYRNAADFRESGTTKAEINEDVPDFEVWRLSYCGENYLCDIDGSVAHKSDGYWKCEGQYRRNSAPVGGAMRYYSFAPAGAEGLVVDREAVKGGEVRAFVSVASQATVEDILVGVSPSYSSGPQHPSIAFSHALCNIVVNSVSAVQWTVTAVRLKGVYSAGLYTLPSKSGASGWSSQSSTVSYSQTVEADLSTPGIVAIASRVNSFLCIPQICPATASIELDVRANSDPSITKTVSASLAGDEWEEGRTVTYALASSSLGFSITLSNAGRVVSADGGTVRKYVYKPEAKSSCPDGWLRSGVNTITVSPGFSVCGIRPAISVSDAVRCPLADEMETGCIYGATLRSSSDGADTYDLSFHPDFSSNPSATRGNYTINVSYGTESATFLCQVCDKPRALFDSSDYMLPEGLWMIPVKYEWDTDVDGNEVRGPISYPLTLTPGTDYPDDLPSVNTNAASVSKGYPDGLVSELELDVNPVSDNDFDLNGPVFVRMVDITGKGYVYWTRVTALPAQGNSSYWPCSFADVLFDDSICSVEYGTGNFPGLALSMFDSGTDNVQIYCNGYYAGNVTDGRGTVTGHRGVNIIAAELLDYDKNILDTEELGISVSMREYDCVELHTSGTDTPYGIYYLRLTTSLPITYTDIRGNRVTATQFDLELDVSNR